MEEQQKHVMVPPSKTATEKEIEYTWSAIRVAEGIAINVGSAILLATLTALVAFLPSTLLLLFQHLFHFLVVPVNLLLILVYFSGAILFVLILGGGLLYLFMRKHPTIVFLMVLAALAGIYLESHPPKINGLKMYSFTPKEGPGPQNTQSQ